MPNLDGSCLCGGVKYTSDAEPAMTAVCHCRHCQKQTGTAFSLVVGLPADSIRFTESKSLAEYDDVGDSGGTVRRLFCNNCGSPIVSFAQAAPGIGFVKAGTLEDRDWLEPQVHIWCETAQPWVTLEDGMAQVPRNPPPP
jgi:hypothetical protein